MTLPGTGVTTRTGEGVPGGRKKEKITRGAPINVGGGRRQERLKTPLRSARQSAAWPDSWTCDKMDLGHVSKGKYHATEV